MSRLVTIAIAAFKKNAANALTILRLVAAAPFCWLLLNGFNIHALAVFAAAALTDYFDGYLARRLGSTRLGRVLDPIADKLLVFTALLTMLALGDRELLLPTVLLVLRETAVAWRRARTRISISTLAKWKTALQMIALGLLMLDGPPAEAGFWLLWLSVALSLASGWVYLGGGEKQQ